MEGAALILVFLVMSAIGVPLAYAMGVSTLAAMVWLDIPLTALRSHLLIGFTEREVSEDELVAVDGREALRTRLSGRR